jgi:hypothetical protein
MEYERANAALGENRGTRERAGAMRPGSRPLVLTLHVVSSVGWLGAVAAFFALGVWSQAVDEPRGGLAAYVAMDLVARVVIVPACLASVATGVLQSLITPWGLFRHYWVLFKLVLTVAGTGLLLLHLTPIREAAMFAGEAAPPLDTLRPVGRQLVIASGAAVLLLLTTTVLSVYKPAGTVTARPAAR